METEKELGLRSPLDIFKIIKQIKKVAKGHPFENLMEEKKMYDFLDIMNTNKRIISWYDKESGELVGILMYDFIEDWYSSQIILAEQLVLKFTEKVRGFQRTAIEELENIARHYEVKYILAGNYLTPLKYKRLIANGYTKAGFSIGYNTFLKEKADE